MNPGSVMDMDAKQKGDHVICVVNPPTDAPPDFCVLEVGNGRGLWVIRVYFDGSMDFNPQFEPTEQAKAFKTSMMMATQRAIWPIAEIH